jgi:glutathione S-transferase
MFELYHVPMSLCAAKVRMVLFEKAQPWESLLLNLQAGDARQPSYLRLNPAGLVPTLVHDGEVIIESNVICEYLEDLFPHGRLRPTEAFRAARMRLWMKRLDDSVHTANWTLSACIGFRHMYLEKHADELEAYYRDLPPDRLERMRNAIEHGIEAPGFMEAFEVFRTLLDDMEVALRAEHWLTGPEYSLADLAYTPYMARVEQLGFGALIQDRPLVAAWCQRAYERPSYQAGVVNWFDPRYLTNFARSSRQAAERVGLAFAAGTTSAPTEPA